MSKGCEKITKFETSDSDDEKALGLEKRVGNSDLKSQPKENENGKYLTITAAAKTCHKYDVNLDVLKKNLVKIEDLNIAHEYIDILVDSLNNVSDKYSKSELYSILGIFYFRAAQLCAKAKIVSTCKLSLNMALMYSEFTVATARENNKKEDQLHQAQTFQDSLKQISEDYFDKLDVEALI